MRNNAADVADIRGEMGIDQQEIDLRKAWLGLDDDDVERLQRVSDFIDPLVDDLVDAVADDLAIDESLNGQGKDRQRQETQEQRHSLSRHLSITHQWPSW